MIESILFLFSSQLSNMLGKFSTITSRLHTLRENQQTNKVIDLRKIVEFSVLFGYLPLTVVTAEDGKFISFVEI